MSWFSLKVQVKDGLVQDRRDDGSPTDWEVLSQAESRTRQATINEAGNDWSASEDDTLIVVDGEDDMKNQVEALRKQLGVVQREKQSLEERLRQRDKAVEALKEESNSVAERARTELKEARQEIQKHKSEVDTVEQDMARMREEMKAVAEESHQAQVRARLEMKGTRLMLEEKVQKIAETERDNNSLREELDAAKAQIDTLETERWEGNAARAQELTEALEEQSRSVKKEMRLLKDESDRLATQNSQVLAMLGVRTLERGEVHAFATKPDLVSDAQVVKMLETLNSEIFEAAAYMADSFTFAPEPAKTNEVREACSRATKMLGPTMVLNLTSVRHDEDPLVVQVACQACMVECCRRIIASWCFDGSKAEDALPDLYSRIRKAEAHAGAVSGRWRALTRTLVRSMLHGQSGDVSSRLIPLVFDVIVDVLLVAGCQGTKMQIRERLAARFGKKMAILATMAVRLNEAIGEEITSCELKVISMPYGVDFCAKTMDDGYDDGKWHGLAPELPQVLCTTELGLQKEVTQYDDKVWQRVVLVKPKISLESLTNGMQLRD